MLLHAPPSVVGPHWDKVLATLEWLLAVQDPLGNWPAAAGRHMPLVPGGAAAHDASKRLGVDEELADAPLQWCHGAPGVLMLLATLLRRAAAAPSAFPLAPERRAAVVAAAARAGGFVYARGLVRKGVGL